MYFDLSLFAFGLLSLAPFVLAVPSASDIPEFMKGKRSFEERDGVKRTIFSHSATSSKMDFVTSSGVCETTPGVNQYSGYFSVGEGMYMWFWFFESRSSPTTAPLAVWLSGGPGCSSMIGLFQENGPCQLYNGSATPSLNPYSWNNYANMLYIDQPVGVGFSYETNPPPPAWTCDANELCTPTGVGNGSDEVNSTVTAAPAVWKFMQAFYAQFPAYENRDFGLFTESYGGHYGPEFTSYFEAQNRGIEMGEVVGQKIDLVALGVNNGCYERLILERSQIDYFYANSYYPLINSSVHAEYLHILEANASGLLEQCAAGGSDQECMRANVNCILAVDDPLGNLIDPTVDGYDIRQHGDDTVPNSDYIAYLTDPAVMNRIGARSNYTECSGPVHDLFSATGDQARSQVPELSSVVASGVNTVIWAGDADAVCNWFGGLAVADSLAWPGKPEFRHAKEANYEVGGKVGGSFKTVGNLSWLRVFAAGHQVPFFPELALQVFTQTMQKKPLCST